ncbi:MAG: AAA family ATPase [Candidatus Nanoarchaeia archaeon]|nr:AAA family ATPase [Candidatus Nanoarchaeia archaeon]MDD5588410.1 AAA family ATPase [Candidatus Nanoarchaeia archaeon]
MKVIIISGSVATGKTTLAKKLVKKLKADYISIKDFAIENKLGFYNKKKEYEIDVEKLNKKLIEVIKKTKKNLIIDGHLSHLLPSKYVDLCIITKCDLKELKKRLLKRKYSQEKIRENLDVEIFDVCLVEASELGHKIKIIDTSK